MPPTHAPSATAKFPRQAAEADDVPSHEVAKVTEEAGAATPHVLAEQAESGAGSLLKAATAGGQSVYPHELAVPMSGGGGGVCLRRVKSLEGNASFYNPQPQPPNACGGEQRERVGDGERSDGEAAR